MYKTQCPYCGCSNCLFVIFFEASTSVPVTEFGFSVVDAPFLDIVGERVWCMECGIEFPLSELALRNKDERKSGIKSGPVQG